MCTIFGVKSIVDIPNLILPASSLDLFNLIFVVVFVFLWLYLNFSAMNVTHYAVLLLWQWLYNVSWLIFILFIIVLTSVAQCTAVTDWIPFVPLGDCLGHDNSLCLSLLWILSLLLTQILDYCWLHCILEFRYPYICYSFLTGWKWFHDTCETGPACNSAQILL